MDTTRVTAKSELTGPALGRRACRREALPSFRTSTAARRMIAIRGLQMCNQNEWIVREAFLAYDQGDVTRLMEFVDQDLEWTYLDSSTADPQPQVCRGRGELEKSLRQQAERGLHAELEEVVAAGDQVIVVMHTPGVDNYRNRQADDRTYDVVTVRDGLIVGLHACRDRGEARSLAGIA
jgi:ketosteroid isomerase-like protein